MMIRCLWWQGDSMGKNGIPASFDATGKLCPELIVEVNSSALGLTVGETLEIIATDPATKRDIPSWCKDTGNVLLESYVNESDYKYHYLIVRTK